MRANDVVDTGSQHNALTNAGDVLQGEDEHRVRLFYQGDLLSNEVSARHSRAVIWAQQSALAQRENEHMQLLQTDRPGSVLGIPNTTLHTLTYSPYGHSAADQVLAFPGFNGQRQEALTMGYLLGNGHRLYSPTLMRFCSADTLSPFDKGGMNAFAYCAGDPVNKVDPTGMFSFSKALGFAEKTGFSKALKTEIKKFAEHRVLEQEIFKQIKAAHKKGDSIFTIRVSASHVQDVNMPETPTTSPVTITRRRDPRVPQQNGQSTAPGSTDNNDLPPRYDQLFPPTPLRPAGAASAFGATTVNNTTRKT